MGAGYAFLFFLKGVGVYELEDDFCEQEEDTEIPKFPRWIESKQVEIYDVDGRYQET